MSYSSRRTFLKTSGAVAAAACAGVNPLAASSSGAVLFTNNMCQLEARASGVQGLASVVILSLDDIIFANNLCWIDGSQTAFTDALLLAISTQVISNRFQEAVGSVFISGYTFGMANITTQNIATNCLFATGLANWTVNTPNVVFDTTQCPDQAKRP